MTIDASSGSFQFVLKDESDTTLLNRTLTAVLCSQASDGTKPDGTAGEGTVNVTITNFIGSDDFSFL